MEIKIASYNSSVKIRYPHVQIYKTPHLLVAGTIVPEIKMLHTMLISLLYKSNASDLKMLFMIQKCWS